MKALYVGIDRPGTTSRNRRLTLERLLPGWEHSHVDTAVPFDHCSRLSRSIAFRLKTGPALRAINASLLLHVEQEKTHYDIVWVDKAVFFYPSTIRRLRQLAGRLIHYTPDTAFYENRSRHFASSIELYDFVVTTKSFEIDQYSSLIPKNRLIVTTQGYDQMVHRPLHTPAEKRSGVAFAGLAERDRFEKVELLLDNGIPVRVAGPGWERFSAKHSKNPQYQFAKSFLSGDEYVDFISSARFGLGLLSKRFPELHTTRTFEIPACGTALITERNEETESYFAPDEAVFHSSPEELIRRLKELEENPNELVKISKAGRARVEKEGRSYDEIFRGLLKALELI